MRSFGEKVQKWKLLDTRGRFFKIKLVLIASHMCSIHYNYSLLSPFSLVSLPFLLSPPLTYLSLPQIHDGQSCVCVCD